jgi:ABC-type phosphate transport system permease subunit
MFEQVLPSIVAGYFGLLIVSFVLRKGGSTESES